MAISILRELDKLSVDGRRSQLTTAFFLTYTLNLSFFEELVLPRLQRIGISHIGILCDRTAYAASLDDGALPYDRSMCGKHYVVGTSPGISVLQHAKMLWLHGQEDRIFVGSHNLTMSGFNDQLEVTALLSSRDSSHITAIRGIHQAASELVQGHRHLSDIWSRVGAPPPNDTPPRVSFLWNRNQGLLDQLSQIVGDVDQIEVVTPYLDASALLRLKQDMSAEKIVLDIPFHGTDTPLPEAVSVVPDLTARRVGQYARRLHGKSYSFTRSDDHWLAIGSANCTNQGLIKSVSEGGNVEFLILAFGESLDEPNEGLEAIEDPSTFEYFTGRNWDEDETSNRMVEIKYAEYIGQSLSVNWSETGIPLDSVTLCCNEVRYPCGDVSPFTIELADAPDVISLEVTSEDKREIVKAWVIHPESLKENATLSRYRGIRDFIASENPNDQARGVDAFFDQMLRDLSEPGMSNDHSFTTSRTADATRIRTAVEALEFSPDIERIEHASSQLISRIPDLDPFAILRGLLARASSTVLPASVQDADAKSVERYQQGRARANRRIVNRLISHLDQLRDQDRWIGVSEEDVSRCLRYTFEAIVHIKDALVHRGSTIDQDSRLRKTLVHFLDHCATFPPTKRASQTSEIAGVIVLAVGAALDHSEQHERSAFLKATQAVVKNPREAFTSWQKEYPDRYKHLMALSRDDGKVERWAQSVFHLYGDLGSAILGYQQTEWGTLLVIHNQYSGKSIPTALISRADESYGDDIGNSQGAKRHKAQVWQRYKRYRQLSFVTQPVCECGIELATNQRSYLKRGDPVLCGSCHRLVIRTSI